MTSKQEVRRVYPKAHIAPRQDILPFTVMGEYTRRGYSAIYLGSAQTEDDAWRDAWRRIQEEQARSEASNDTNTR